MNSVKLYLAKSASRILILLMLVAFGWMGIAALTLFSVYDYFRLGHFIVAGFVACIAGQWFDDINEWIEYEQRAV